MLSTRRTLLTVLCGLLLLAPAVALAQPDAPTPALPGDGATDVPLTARLLWRPVADAVSYELQLAYDATFSQLAMQVATEAWEVDAADLWDDMLYYWRVRAIDTLDSTSVWSAPRSFRTIVTGAPRPASPIDGASDLPVDQISLNFTYPTIPPSGFEVMYGFGSDLRGGISIEVPGAVRSTSLPTMPADTTVYWRVRVAAGPAAGPGAWSRTMRFATAPPPPMVLGECSPVAPANGYTMSDLLVSSVWRGPSLHGSTVLYQVQFGQDASMREVLLNFDDVDTTALDVQLPEGSATWYWRVRAISTSDDLIDGPWSATWMFTLQEVVETALGVPSLLLPPNGAPARGAWVSLAWDSVPRGESYEVEVGRDSTFESIDTMMISTNTAARIGGLLRDTMYAWRVRAIASDGENRGPWSTHFTFDTHAGEIALPGTPQPVAPENEVMGIDPLVGFRWDPASMATAHLIQISDDSTFAGGIREFGAFDSSATAQLEEAKRWWWRVRGINEAGLGAWSPVWTFTTARGTTSAPLAASSRIEQARIVPMPAATDARLIVTQAVPGEHRLSIANMMGESVLERMIRAGADGSISVELPVATFAPGVYRCRIISTDGSMIETPLVVTR